MIIVRFSGGGVVDPDSGKQNVAHVFCKNALNYCAILALVDINANKNSYFKMQLLESDTMPKMYINYLFSINDLLSEIFYEKMIVFKYCRYWLFTANGRIGTSIGSTHITYFEGGVKKARSHFEALYFEKTGNQFGAEKFEKKIGKYNQMNIEYESKEAPPLSTATSNLTEPVFKLMELLFNVDMMEETLLAFDLDTEQMPLGKISAHQIQEAQMLLQEIDRMMSEENVTAKIDDASNRFYMLIPHKFDTRPPKINTKEMVRNKLEMLDALMQMEITYTLLKGNHDKKKHPFDVYYEKLNTDIELLDKNSSEYQEILQYVVNTGYGYDCIDAVYKISRHEEVQRFKPYEKNFNRQLLFHGSRLTNFVGILS